MIIITNKNCFIKEIEILIQNNPISVEALEFFNSLKNGTVTNGEITEKGAKILKALQEKEKEYLNQYPDAKDFRMSSSQIGEATFMTSRSVSGAIRKLVTDEYVLKIGKSPVYYNLTEKGRLYNFT